jgi:hypothetical protein
MRSEIDICQENQAYLGAFAKSRKKKTISFVKSVRQTVHIEQLGSHWTDLYEI